MVVLHEMLLLRLPFPEAVAEEIVAAAAVVVDDGVVATALTTDPMRIKQEQHRHFEIVDRWDVLPLPDHHHDCGHAVVKALLGDVVVVAEATTKEAVGLLRLSKTMRVEDGPGIHLHLFLAILLLDDHLPY